MPKGPKIKDWVKWRVGIEALSNRKEPRESVAQRIEDFLEGKEAVPSRDTLLKMISSARNSDNPQDKPWSTDTLDQYPIPPEALLAVLRVWKSRFEKDTGFTFTIREAKWVSRLSALSQDIEKLSSTADLYANSERISEHMKLTRSNTFFDMLLVGLPEAIESLRDKNTFRHYLVYGKNDVLQILQIEEAQNERVNKAKR